MSSGRESKQPFLSYLQLRVQLCPPPRQPSLLSVLIYLNLLVCTAAEKAPTSWQRSFKR